MGTNVQTYIGRRIANLTPTEFFHLVQQLPHLRVTVTINDAEQYCYVVRYQGLLFQTQSLSKLQLPANKPTALVTEMFMPYARGLFVRGVYSDERMPPL